MILKESDSFMERLLQRKGNQRLLEVGRSGMHTDYVRREGVRWLRACAAAASLGAAAVLATIAFGYQLDSSWQQSRLARAQIAEQHVQAVSNCLSTLILRAGQMTSSETMPDPLAACQREVTTQEAYVFHVAFPAPQVTRSIG